MPVPAPGPPTDERPALFKLGVALLVVHELVVLGLCTLGGVLGSFAILIGSLDGRAREETGLLVLLGALGALLLLVGMGLAIASLVVCALAWKGSRLWLQVLIAVALFNCVLVAPNPLGILAAVLCVLGTLQYLENLGGDPKIRVAPGPGTPVPAGADGSDTDREV